MNAAQRTLVIAIVTAALIGLAVGWLVRRWTEPTVEDRMIDAAKQLREKATELSR
jgi:hypothetical protein